MKYGFKTTYVNQEELGYWEVEGDEEDEDGNWYEDGTLLPIIIPSVIKDYIAKNLNPNTTKQKLPEIVR